MNVLADLLEVTATCIGDLVKETREILEDHGHDPGVAPVRFTNHDALLAFADSDLRPARTTVIEQLSHPALTGLTRRELHDLTRRLAARQSAQTERLSYQRRGGPRQPCTTGSATSKPPPPNTPNSSSSTPSSPACSPRPPDRTHKEMEIVEMAHDKNHAGDGHSLGGLVARVPSGEPRSYLQIS